MSMQPRKLSPGGVVTLFEIDFSKCLGFKPTGTTLIRCSSYRNGNSDIVFGGNTYSYIGVTGSGFRSELGASAPTPSLRFDKASLYSNSTYQSLTTQFRSQTGLQFFDWRGAQVKIIKYYVSAGTVEAEQEFIVDSVGNITKEDLSVNLTVSIGIDALSSESVSTLGLNVCRLKYRKWNGSDFNYTPEADDGCPYGNSASASKYTAVPDFGIKFYTSDDIELLPANKQYDQCSLGVKGCQLRFDPDSNGLNLPFKGLTSPIPKVGE